MNWAQIKKSVNSDLNTPLNSKIDSQTTSLNNKIDMQTTALANKFGLTFESTNTYKVQDGQYTEWTPSKDGIIVATAASSSEFVVGLSVHIAYSYPSVDQPIIVLKRGANNVNLQGQAVAPIKASQTLYIVGSGTITYYSWGGGAFRKCFENLIANILLKKGGVLA